MELVLTLDGDGSSSDALRSLRAWLLEEDELRGCVRIRERPPAPGHLGPVLDALQIGATPAAAVLSAALVAWLKTRVGNVRLVMTPKQGVKVEMEAKNVRSLDTEKLVELTERLTRCAAGSSHVRIGAGDVASPDTSARPVRQQAPQSAASQEN